MCAVVCLLNADRARVRALRSDQPAARKFKVRTRRFKSVPDSSRPAGICDSRAKARLWSGVADCEWNPLFQFGEPALMA